MEVPTCSSVARVRVFFPLEDPPLAFNLENLACLAAVPVSEEYLEQPACHLHGLGTMF